MCAEGPDTELAARLTAALSLSTEAPPDLGAAFAAAGLVDVAYTIEPSPLGDLLLAATPSGLLRVAYPSVDPDAVLAQIAQMISPRIIRLASRLDPARRQLEEYFSGRRRRFALALDRRLVRPGYFADVLDATAQIPYGDSASYGTIAAAAGRPRAHRAAGTALGANPLPVIIPCHRVRAADGRLGGYTGGVERKQLLLELERTQFRR